MADPCFEILLTCLVLQRSCVFLTDRLPQIVQQRKLAGPVRLGVFLIPANQSAKVTEADRAKVTSDTQHGDVLLTVSHIQSSQY